MTSPFLSHNRYGSVHCKTIGEQVDNLIIEHDCCKASVCLYGGHVLNWQPKGKQEVFWLSKNAEYQHGKAIRGGIPICWPWFGPNINEQGVNGGNHGFARNHTWQLIEATISQDKVQLVIELTGDRVHPLWPHQFSLRQVLSFGEHFEQCLIMTNLSNQDAHYSCALHSYFAVSHPNNVHVDQLSGCFFDDKLTQSLNQKDQLANCVGPIDRIYHCDGKQQVIDKQWQRLIIVESTNCQQWVLWNPGRETAEKMADIHSGGENEYVCLEAANTNWQPLAAGASVEIQQRVSVAELVK